MEYGETSDAGALMNPHAARRRPNQGTEDDSSKGTPYAEWQNEEKKIRVAIISTSVSVLHHWLC